MKDNRPLSAAQEAAEERALYEAVMALDTVDECRRFFRDLCTPAELQALKDRWAVVGLLRRKHTYRDIHDRTGVSVTTIGRINRFLEDGNGGYQLVAERTEGQA